MEAIDASNRAAYKKLIMHAPAFSGMRDRSEGLRAEGRPLRLWGSASHPRQVHRRLPRLSPAGGLLRAESR